MKTYHDLQVELYYLIMELQGLCLSMKELPVSELDIKNVMQRKAAEIIRTLDGIKEGE